MVEMKGELPQASPEQLRYATVLEKGMLVGLVVLFVTFILYCLQIIKPYIPVSELHKYWKLNVHDYLEAAKAPHGWSWIAYLNMGDYLNYVGIVILSGITILCFLSIVPVLLKKKDRLYAILSLIQAAILIFAASGIIKVGH
jgi:heme exporter protein D